MYAYIYLFTQKTQNAQATGHGVSNYTSKVDPAIFHNI